MTGFIEDEVLRAEGLDDADIALINQELPDLENLITVLESHLAQINRVMKLLAVVQKVIAKQESMK